MFKFSRYVTDSTGIIQTSGTVTVSAATIYSDNSGTVKANPFSLPASGLAEFYLANQRFTVTIVSPAGTVVLSDLLALDVDELSGDVTVADNLIVTDNLTVNGSFNPAIVNTGARNDVTSAATVDLNAATSNYVRITGTTTITAVTLSDGRWRDVLFADTLTLTNGASLILPGGANIVTVAGDSCRVFGESGSVVRVTNYTRAAPVPFNTDAVTTIASGSINTGGDTSISIPAGAWKEVELVITGLQSASDFLPFLRINADTGANYDYVNHLSQNGTTSNTVGTGTTGICLYKNSVLVDESDVTANPMYLKISIGEPANTARRKRVSIAPTFARDSAAVLANIITSGGWNSVSAITSLSILLRDTVNASPTGVTINASDGVYVLRGYK